MEITKTQVSNITKLTALWATSESVLGGILHGMHIPMSGVVLAGFAVIIISLIAKYSDHPSRDILQSLVIVLLIKGIASPHSPITAYIAVSFQALLAAVIYYFFPVRYFSAVTFGVISLLESALQKIGVLTFIFGMHLWSAFRDFFDQLAFQLDFIPLQDMPYLLLCLYLFIYLIAGIAAGIFSVQIPRLIEVEWNFIQKNPIDTSSPKTTKTSILREYRMGILITCALLFFGVLIYSIPDEQLGWVLLRSLLALILIYGIITPLFRFWLKRWKKKAHTKSPTKLISVLNLMPQFKKNARTAIIYAEKESNALRKVRKFAIVWIALSINATHE